MITAVQKPFPEIEAMVQGNARLLVLGCGTCVTVCLAGGEKETAVLGLHPAPGQPREGREDADRGGHHRAVSATGSSSTRCGTKWKPPTPVLSLACGVGVQFASEVFPGKRVLPG